MVHRVRLAKVVCWVFGSSMIAVTAACETSGPQDSQATPSDAQSSVETPARPTVPGEATPIRITVGDDVLHADVWDNPAGRSLIEQLPLTADFTDHNGEEKVGHLDTPLTMAGMPAGDDPRPHDLGWYAPWGNLVFYYGDVGYWDGIARIGTFTDEMAPVAEQDGDFTAVIELDR